MREKKLLKSTVAVTAAMLVTRILGLVREAVLAAIYGAGTVTDAFIASFTMPNTILACIGTSLATVYIPLYQENKEDANRFTSNISNIVSLIGLALTAVFVMFPGALVSLFASGFSGETYELATQFTRIMMLATIPILLFNVLKAYLQIFNAFFLATALDGIINLLVIVGIYVSKPADNIKIMAYAAVLGNFMCFVCLIRSCSKYGLKYVPYLNFREERVKKVLHLILPVFIGTAVAELNTIVDRNFASTLTSGTISAMNYANKVNGILYSFLSTSIATVLYPELVRLSSEKKKDEIKGYISKCVLILTYIILPLSLLIIILARPIVGILFQRGAFGVEDAKMTAECIQMYAIGYLTININPVLNRVFYAYNDTKTPMINSIIAVILNIILNVATVHKYKHMGLAFSSSVASVFTTILLLIQLKKKLNGLEFRKLARDLAKIILASAAMCISIYAIYGYVESYMNGMLMTLLATILIAVIALLVYVTCTSIFKVGITLEIKTVIAGKLRRK